MSQTDKGICLQSKVLKKTKLGIGITKNAFCYKNSKIIPAKNYFAHKYQSKCTKLILIFFCSWLCTLLDWE